MIVKRWRVALSPKAAKSKVPYILIDRTAQLVNMQPQQRPYKKYHKTIVLPDGGHKIVLIYEFHEERVIYIRNAWFKKG